MVLKENPFFGQSWEGKGIVGNLPGRGLHPLGETGLELRCEKPSIFDNDSLQRRQTYLREQSEGVENDRRRYYR